MKPLQDTISKLASYLIIVFSALLIIGSFPLLALACRTEKHILTLTSLVMLILGIFFVNICEAISKKPLRIDTAGHVTAYCITAAYVLPYAANTWRQRKGKYQVTFRQSFTLDEIATAYNYMEKRHRVYYRFQKYNIPGTTAQVQIGISMKTAIRLLAEMRNGQSVVLETIINGEDSDNIPQKQSFITTADVLSLRKTIQQNGTANWTVVYLNTNRMAKIELLYLQTCESLLVSTNELINLPRCRGLTVIRKPFPGATITR